MTSESWHCEHLVLRACLKGKFWELYVRMCLCAVSSQEFSRAVSHASPTSADLLNLGNLNDSKSLAACLFIITRAFRASGYPRVWIPCGAFLCLQQFSFFSRRPHLSSKVHSSSLLTHVSKYQYYYYYCYYYHYYGYCWQSYQYYISITSAGAAAGSLFGGGGGASSGGSS